MSFVDDYILDEARDEDGNEVTFKTATKREVATGRHVQELVLHPDSVDALAAALGGGGGGLSGSAVVDLDTDYSGGTANLTGEPPKAVWFIHNLAGSATVNLPATTGRFALYLADIADLSALTLQVAGVGIIDAGGALGYETTGVTVDVYPGSDLSGGAPIMVPIDKVKTAAVYDENWGSNYPTLAPSGAKQTDFNAAAEAFALDVVTFRAPIASPALTGTPTAPTAAGGTNTTQIATTAFTTGAIAAQAAKRTVVRKPSDTSKTSDTTVASDPHLTASVGTGTFLVKVVAIFDSATNADLNIGLATPGSSTVRGAIFGPAISASAVGHTVAYLGPASANAAAGGIGVGTSTVVEVRATVVTTGSGSIAVQWAQNTTQATATTVSAGSSIEVEQIA